MTDISSVGIQGTIVTPSSPDYDDSIKRVSATSVLKPSYVVFPTSASDISKAVQYATSHSPPLEIAVKSGGCHTSTNSSSEGGLVVDLAKLNKITVAEDKQSVTIQGGARWGQVYEELDKHGLVCVGGNVHFVGVGGFLTGGGYSNLSGHYGLAIDNLLSATVILADGSVVKTDKDHEPDLFWAIRGGGNQFGIVADFTVKTYPAHGSATVGALGYPGTELANVVQAVKKFTAQQTPGQWLIMTFARAPPEFYPSILLLPYIEGTPEEGEKALEPLKTDVKPVFEQIFSAPNFNTVSHGADAMLAHIPPRAATGGATFTDIWDDVVGQIFGEWAAFTDPSVDAGDRLQSVIMWEFPYREKIASVPSDATAFPLRVPHSYVVATARYSKPDSDKVAKDWSAKVTKIVRDAQKSRGGKALPSPANFSLGPDYDTAEEVYGDNLPRLKKVKAKYDPKKVWRKGWVIEPDFN
ncbi:FAD-binding domain-containing protein [Panus rudis PR-1116 ss-1]|nr:FAD-binding domain-containing protein [Panus rudis PR-1116 ss-1]